MTERAGLDLASGTQNAFLLASRVGRLATVGARSEPHAVPVCFAIVGGRIYSPLDEKPKRVEPHRLKRVRNVILHPAVCLVVDRYSEDWGELAWVQVHAEAAVIEPASDEHAAAASGLRERYPQYREMALERCPMLCLSPLRVVSWGL